MFKLTKRRAFNLFIGFVIGFALVASLQACGVPSTEQPVSAPPNVAAAEAGTVADDLYTVVIGNDSLDSSTQTTVAWYNGLVGKYYQGRKIIALKGISVVNSSGYHQVFALVSLAGR